jgi:anti-repressor protein
MPPDKRSGPQPAAGSRPNINNFATATIPAPAVSEVFRFPDTGQGVRVVTIDGEPWFAAADACAVLGLAHTGSALRILDDDERQTLRYSRSEGVLSEHTATGQRVQRLVFIAESGLYSLIVRSQVPGAVAFRRWVTHEVLPQIRKTGSYAPAPAVATPGVPDIATPAGVLAMAEMLHQTAARLVGAEKQVAELEPAAEAWGTLAAAEGDYSLRDAAHILNRDPAISTGQNRLMQFLREEQLVDRKGIPYVRYAQYLVERPVSYNHPRTGEPMLTQQIRITPDGLAYLRHRLGGRAA